MCKEMARKGGYAYDGSLGLSEFQAFRDSKIDRSQMKTRIGLAIASLGLLFVASAISQDTDRQQSNTKVASPMPEKVLLKKLLGKWEGSCRTWFEPNKLADESKVSGEFENVLDGRFVRHTYQSMIQGKPRRGEELIAFNAVAKKFESTWVDDFHMNYAIMFSQGEVTQRGFKVRGEYDVGNDQPKWGWRTEYELVDDNHLIITAYNILPDGDEAKAVETNYAASSDFSQQQQSPCQG